MFNVFSAMPNEELFRWQGSHGDFVTFAILVTRLSGTDFDDPAFSDKLEVTGEGLLDIVNIDIAPYADFTSLCQAVPPSTNLIMKMMECVSREIAFEDVMEDTGVDPSPESRAEHMTDLMMGYEMARRLKLLGDGDGKQLPEGRDY